LAFGEAENLFLALVRRNDKTFAEIAREWLELIRLYQELMTISAKRSTAFMFDKKWEAYLKLYEPPKKFIDGIFDPKNFAKRDDTPSPNNATPPAPPSQDEGLEMWRVPSVARPRFTLPAPFAWVDIPAGRVTLEDGMGPHDVPAFQIAKYPITNAQYAKFIEASGYENQAWWTD